MLYSSLSLGDSGLPSACPLAMRLPLPSARLSACTRASHSGRSTIGLSGACLRPHIPNTHLFPFAKTKTSIENSLIWLNYHRCRNGCNCLVWIVCSSFSRSRNSFLRQSSSVSARLSLRNKLTVSGSNDLATAYFSH